MDLRSLLCPIALNYMSSIAVCGVGACSCYRCLIGHNKRELLVYWYCGATLAVVSSHNVCRCIFYLSLSSI